MCACVYLYRALRPWSTRPASSATCMRFLCYTEVWHKEPVKLFIGGQRNFICPSLAILSGASRQTIALTCTFSPAVLAQWHGRCTRAANISSQLPILKPKALGILTDSHNYGSKRQSVPNTQPTIIYAASMEAASLLLL